MELYEEARELFIFDAPANRAAPFHFRRAWRQAEKQMTTRKTKKPTAESFEARIAKPTVQLSQRRSDEALRQVLDLIFQGKLPPGSRLPAERELAELIGVSRNTLRDALNKLEARGYLERRDRSGNYVC